MEGKIIVRSSKYHQQALDCSAIYYPRKRRKLIYAFSLEEHNPSELCVVLCLGCICMRKYFDAVFIILSCMSSHHNHSKSIVASSFQKQKPLVAIISIRAELI